MAKETLTVLVTERTKLAAKEIVRTAHGELTTRPLRTSYWYDVEEVPVEGLLGLGHSFSRIEGDPRRLVIRGRLIEGRPNEGVRRLLKPQGEDPAYFEAAARPWCMIDIDNVPLPSALSKIVDHPHEIAAIAAAVLPEAFQGVDFWYRFSASMGVKKDRIRIHLWFWLSRPVSDQELKSWLGGCPVDLAVFNPVQPHYTAAPLLGDGVEDPMPNRSGFCRAGQSVETVPVPDTLDFAPVRNRRETAIGGGGTGSEIVRDPDTGLVVDGRRTFLLVSSNKAMTQAVQSGVGEDISATELADRTWEIFSQGADVSDGKWTLSNAYDEAERRLTEFRDGTYDFTSRQDVTTLYPALAPFVTPNFVDRQTGTAALDAALSRFFARAGDKAPRVALRVTMGTGKTKRTVDFLKEHLASAIGAVVEIYVPWHDLAREYVAELLAGDAVQAKVVHLIPRDTPTEDHPEGLCLRSEYIKGLKKAGLGIFQNACRSNDGKRCEFYDDCAYIEQFRDPPLHENRGNIVRIGVHSSLGLPRNPIQSEPDTVIIDESFISSLIKQTPLNEKTIRDNIKTDLHPELGSFIVRTLQDGLPLLRKLREVRIAPKDLASIQLDHLRPKVQFWSSSDQAHTIPSAFLFQELSTFLKVLIEEMNLGNRDHVERLVYDPSQDKISLTHLNLPDFTNDKPLLILDATADPMLLEEVIGPVEFERIDIHQRAFTTQVYDRTGSNHFWNGNTAPISDLISVLNLWSELGERPLVIAHKALADRLRSSKDLNEGVIVNHFQNLRGSNAAKDATVIFITGRNSPPPYAVDRAARAIFWSAEPPLIHDSAVVPDESGRQARLPAVLRGYLQSEENPQPQSGVYIGQFEDERVEALYRQSKEAETIQAIARLRLVYADYRKYVYLLSNLPTEMPVDRFAKFDEIMPDRLEIELIKQGSIPLTPLGLTKMRPDLAFSPSNAKKFLQRSRISDTERLRSLHPLTRSGLVIVEFTASNAGRKNKHKHLFILRDQRLERVWETAPVAISAGEIPIARWVAYLEQGDPDIPGSGWGEVHDVRVYFANP